MEVHDLTSVYKLYKIPKSEIKITIKFHLYFIEYGKGIINSNDASLSGYS